MVTFVSQVTNRAGSQAPGEQYVFFGAKPKPGEKEGVNPEMNLVKLTDFIVTAPMGNGGSLIAADPKNPDCVKVMAPDGAAVLTGLLYNERGQPGSMEDLVSFRIINPVAGSFSFWVLDSTTSENSNRNTELAVRVNGGELLARHETSRTPSGNEFSKFTVTGATISDVFTVAVKADTKRSFRCLAGLSFAVNPAPTTAGRKPPNIYQSDWIDLNKNGRKDPYEDPSQPVEKRIENLLGMMTLEEKLGQLSQEVRFGDQSEKKDAARFPAIRRGSVGSYIWLGTAPAVRNQFQRIAVQESRLGIPLIFGMDIIHGASTLFPIALGQACAFDPALMERTQTVAAREARAEGLDWVFAPMCDLARDPRWGRVAETCGEDPYLSALCNAAQVRGFQGNNIAAPDRVAACLKHYVGYSATTGGRDKNDTEITEWTLHNAHLPPFQAGIKAGAMTIMSAFNAIDGIPTTANHHLVTDILRDELKFRGFVVSDWDAVAQMICWGYAKDKADAARLAINAGTDMDMRSEAYVPNLAAEIKAGRVSQSTVDEAARRVLRVKFMLGLFDRPYVNELEHASAQMHPDALLLAREAVAKSTVLVKNNGVLPLSKEIKKIALIGPVGDDPVEIQGCWSGRSGWGTTLAKGIKDKIAKDAILTIVKGCDVSVEPRTKTLADGSVVLDDSVAAVSANVQFDEAVHAAKDADVVVMAVGEPRGWTGEGGSVMYLSLGGKQQALFDTVAATGKPIVTIVFSGRPLSLPSVWEKSAAVFYAWQPGIQAGPGLADLLFGDLSPSGRLSMSVLRDVGQAPYYYNYLRTGLPDFSFRDYTVGKVQYWFGYGLTYTTFDYSPARIIPAADGKPAWAEASITNTGKRDGDEVVQLYISQLVCHEGARPKQELRGFQHIKLKPGEKTTVLFPLTGEVLGYFDRKGKPRADAGDYEIYIAPSAHKGTPVIFNFSS